MTKRPKRASDGVKRQTFTFRMTLEMQARVAEAASLSGRSVSEELERIVEAHFAAADQRTIIREEVRAAFMDHEADLAVARVRRSSALEELARMDGELLPSADFSWLWADAKPSA